MQGRGHDCRRDGAPLAPLLGVAAAIGAAMTALHTGATGDQLVAGASLLLLGDARERSDLAALAGSLVAGSLLGAAVGYAATDWLTVLPIAVEGGVGLGLALGGGIGAVSNLFAADAGGDGDATGGAESMTVDMASDDAPAPRPADLFDDHPDPVLYVADQGHGPVVLAANDAFAERFDVPAAAISETPLGEALLATDDEDEAATAREVGRALAAGEPVDVVLTCQAPDGPTRFRLRSAGGGADGYVVYTPVDGDA